VRPYFSCGPVLRETIVALFSVARAARVAAFHVLRDVYLAMQPDTVERLLARRGQRFPAVRRILGLGAAPAPGGARGETAGTCCRRRGPCCSARTPLACGASFLAEARGEHAAEENPMRRCSVYFAYEESPPQPAAPRGVRARGAGIVSVAGRRRSCSWRTPRSATSSTGQTVLIAAARAERAGTVGVFTFASHQALARQLCPPSTSRPRK